MPLHSSRRKFSRRLRIEHRSSNGKEGCWFLCEVVLKIIDINHVQQAFLVLHAVEEPIVDEMEVATWSDLLVFEFMDDDVGAVVEVYV